MSRKMTSAVHEAANLEAAKLILKQPDRHGGIDAFSCIWTRLFLERYAERQEQQVGPLFRRTAA